MAPQAAPAAPQSPPQTNGQPSTPESFEGKAWLEKALEIAEAARPRGEIKLTEQGVDFGNFEGVQRYARLLVQCGCVPLIKDDNPEQQFARAVMCILLGRRVGLAPEQAVTSIYVVNCRPVIFGDAPLAICRQHPQWEESGFDEWFEVDGQRVRGEPDPEDFTKDTTCCVVQTLRKGAKAPKTTRFSIGHAKKAGLFGRNAALYGGYPQRMLLFRARGYNLRDNFGDALKGIGVRELVDPDETEQSRPVESVLPVGRLDLATPTDNGTQAPSAAPVEARPEAPKPVSQPKPAAPEQAPTQEEAPAPKAKKGDNRQHLRTLKFQVKEYKITPGALANALIELGLRGEEATDPVDLEALSEDDCARLVDEIAKPKAGTEPKAGGELFAGKTEAQKERR